VVLLDLKMPNVDGVEVPRAIKGDPHLKLIPVVIMTSSRADWASPSSCAICAFPGSSFGVDEPPLPALLRMVAAQLHVPVEHGDAYGQLEREYLVELQRAFGFKPFTVSHYRQAVQTLTDPGRRTKASCSPGL
jgi:CheY-like chemotaxis protein